MRILLVICVMIFISDGYSHKTKINQPPADIQRIKNDLQKIIYTPNYRNHLNLDALSQVTDYIKSEFSKVSNDVTEQPFTVNGKVYKNIICSMNSDCKERIIVGAHYDVCGDQQGADDNASGVAGLLELARLLKSQHLKYRIDLVAYCLEEPPYFETEQMGSYIHAKYLFDNKIQVKGMICLEMIGYFKDEKKSQQFPLNFLRLFYGNKGNFITVVEKFGNGRFGKIIKRLMKRSGFIRTKFFQGPISVEGVDFSDHLNYWKFGFPAAMITDTSFYRNPNYHKSPDTIATLDILRMAGVIDGILFALTNIC
jgi:hypothetical protein